MGDGEGWLAPASTRSAKAWKMNFGPPSELPFDKSGDIRLAESNVHGMFSLQRVNASH